MRVARSNGLSARALLVAAFALVCLSTPPVVAATDTTLCDPMKPKMQAGYRALENRQYADAEKMFAKAGDEYSLCYAMTPAGGAATPAPKQTYWAAYARAGEAAAEFGAGKITDGLKTARGAESFFRLVISGTGLGEGASDSLRRLASDGLVYVQSLMSAKKPILPKIWLDWKVAHP